MPQEESSRGKVVVEDERLDEGSTVTVFLPESDNEIPLSPEEEAKLNQALKEADEGDFIEADADPFTVCIVSTPVAARGLRSPRCRIEWARWQTLWSRLWTSLEKRVLKADVIRNRCHRSESARSAKPGEHRARHDVVLHGRRPRRGVSLRADGRRSDGSVGVFGGPHGIRAGRRRERVRSRV